MFHLFACAKRSSSNFPLMLHKKNFITMYNCNYSRRVISQLTPDSKPCMKISHHTAPLSLRLLIMTMTMKSLKVTMKKFTNGKVGTWAYIVHYKQPFAFYPILLPKTIRLATYSL